MRVLVEVLVLPEGVVMVLDLVLVPASRVLVLVRLTPPGVVMVLERVVLAGPWAVRVLVREVLRCMVPLCCVVVVAAPV
jgi:hypothetical protein